MTVPSDDSPVDIQSARTCVKPTIEVELPEGLKERNDPKMDNADDDEVESYSTLLSDHHDSDDCSSINEPLTDSRAGDDELQCLESKFLARDKLLSRLSKEQPAEYVRMLRESEEMVRAHAYRSLTQRRARKLKTRNGMTRESANEKETQTNGGMKAPDEMGASDGRGKYSPTTKSMIWKTLAFEFRHSVKGYATVVLFCATHMALYELISTCVTELTKNVKNQTMVNLYTLLIGLLLCRMSGGLWSYVGKNTYRCVKFDMHNRLRLGHWDARALLWFHRHADIQAAVSLLGIYLCFVPVVNVQSQILSIADVRREILKDLPSAAHDVSTTIQQTLAYGIMTDKLNGITCAGEECTAGEAIAELTLQDELYVWSKLSASSYMQLIGYHGAAAVSAVSTVIIYGVLVAIYLRLLAKLDFSFAL